MHQLLCAVNDTVFVDGYRVQVLEVTADGVVIGLSTRGGGNVVHRIALPAGLEVEAARPERHAAFRRAAN